MQLLSKVVYNLLIFDKKINWNEDTYELHGK